MFEFDVPAYLQRVGLDTTPMVSEEGLIQMHRAQAFSIPFENFDIQLGKTIDLSPRALFEKAVLNIRGGYCFELNGLFLLALRSFGFEARSLLARVHLRGVPTARTHQLLLVRIQGRDWIADVGFGASGLREPIPFTLDQVAAQDGLKFRLIDASPFGIMLQVEEDNDWRNLYSFDLTHVSEADIAMSNYFTETHPDSLFTKAWVATLPNATGRVSLLNTTLRKTMGNRVEVIELDSGQAYLDAIEEHFGIRLNR